MSQDVRIRAPAAPPAPAGPPDPYVLSEKIRAPVANGLVRERLERPLYGPAGPGLAFVFAPAGSGKTTLLARLAHTSPEPVAWYRVTPADTDERLLAAGLARALQSAAAPGISLRGAAVDDVLEAADRALGPHTLLILDDLHHLAGSGAEAALERFIGLRPAGLRVVVGSRHLPAWDLPRLMLCEQVARVGGDELRFRYWEVEELYSRVYGEPLGPEAAAALTRRTGGWAAGLQLFHLATAGRAAADRRRAASRLGGRSGLVRSYLARNVLAELPADRRRFLVLTSTLGVLTGPLCDALLDTSASIEVLDELERQQLFTSSSDDGTTFRYHPILEAHLHAALVETYGNAGAAATFARSGRLLEDAGHHRDAVLAYARAEDWGAVARLVHDPQSDLTVGGLAGGERLLRAGQDAEDPWLTLALARLRLRQGNVRAAVAGYRAAESMLDEPAFRATCHAERSLAALWLPEPARTGAVPGTAAARIRAATRGDPPARAGAGRAGSGTAEPGDQLADGLAALLHGDLGAAAGALRSVVAAREVTPAAVVAARLALSVLDQLDPPHDPAGDALGVLEQAVLEAEYAGQPFLARLAAVLLEAQLVYASASPDDRRHACAELRRACDRDDDAWGAALAELVFGFASNLAGHPEPLGDLAVAATRFRALDAPVLAAWAQAAGALTGAWLTGSVPPEVVRSAAGQPGGGTPGARVLAAAAAEVSAPVPASQRGSALRAVAARLLSPAGRRAQPGPPAGPVARLHITCLGGFRCDVGGRPLDWATARPRAVQLFRLLALAAGRPLHREYLVDALWPGTDVDAGTRQLHVAVSSLRRVLNDAGLAGTELLVRHGDAYALVLPDGSVDAAELERWLQRLQAARVSGDEAGAVGAAHAVLELYAGDLLPADGPAEWVVHDRDRLRRATALAATVVAADHRRRGEHAGALGAAERAIELDPYADQARELLALIHEDTGDRAAAARCRHEHARLLADLGVV